MNGGGVYAGNVADGFNPHGHGIYWSVDGRRCFEGEWAHDSPIGEGTMLLDDGALWLVRFDRTKRVYGDSVWKVAERLAYLGRVLEDQSVPVARREERGTAPKWIATVELADGRKVVQSFLGLTKVFH